MKPNNSANKKSAPKPIQPTTKQVLDLLFVHNAEFIKDLLRKSKLTAKGRTKADQRTRLEQALKKGEISIYELILFLDEIEGWGNQQIYLFQSSDKLKSLWRKEKHVQKILTANGLDKLLNQPRAIWLPDMPEFSAISYDGNRIRIVWTVRRTSKIRIKSKDQYDKNVRIEWRAYKLKDERGTIAFDWNLGSGSAMLTIQKLPSGTNYEAVLIEMKDLLRPVIDLDSFEQVRLNTAIKNIHSSIETRIRKQTYTTPSGSDAIFKSGSKGEDLHDDQSIRDAEDIILATDKSTGANGNYYWHTAGPLKRDLHVTIDGQTHRIGIFGERREEEVRYVIGRIKSYC